MEGVDITQKRQVWRDIMWCRNELGVRKRMASAGKQNCQEYRKLRERTGRAWKE